MIPAAHRYHRASSLEDALSALGEEDARALAGGQSLLPVMKLRLARPSLLVDIGRLELAGLERRGDTLHIGALTTWDGLARAPEVAGPELAALADCARGTGDLQVRNLGTIGGGLAHADPASDMPAALLAVGAEVELRSQEGSRTVAVGDLLLGPFTTSIAPAELLTEIVVPVPPPGSGSAYVAVEHPASGFAIAGAAALVSHGSERVAVTGIGATPVLLAGGESSLGEIEVYGDRFAPGPYRRELARVVVRRAVERARQRAEGGA